MGRYDVSLADERGAVRADQHRDWSDLRARERYTRDFDPRSTTTWRRPDDLRGYRGGSAGSYGFGDDHDVVRYGADRNLRGGASGIGRRRTRNDYDRAFARRQATGGGNYDRELRSMRPNEPLAREIRHENADLVRDYLREDPEYRQRGGWSTDELRRDRGRYGAELWTNRGDFGARRATYDTEFSPRRGRGRR